MFVTECRAEFLGHQIVARNSWGLTFSLKGMTGENRLYIDGELVDNNTEMVALQARQSCVDASSTNRTMHMLWRFMPEVA